ncbi:unnamed protein product [Adineta ricciae]|uniref:Cation efflux protein transmembrane domain-containing protein n=1 Tax=Adineta ricciae TaxID=249248 RepID=A0A814CA04_ADIRI|nr:unnamed protein product [Adineta ricciae]
MLLASVLLINNIILFVLETVGYHTCHSVILLLDGYYHLCQAILCTVRIVSQLIQYRCTARHTYGLARIGVLGELVAFICFIALSVSVFFESIKHVVNVIFVNSQRENNSTSLFSAHSHEQNLNLTNYTHFILGIGIYGTISNCLLGFVILCIVIKRSIKFEKQLKQRRPSLKQPLPRKLLSKSHLITDTLSIRHSYLQVLNMLLGPVAIFVCGILLVMLSDKQHIIISFTRLIDPIVCCSLFLSYILIIFIPMRHVMHLVLQANPCDLKAEQVEKILCDSVRIVSIHELHIWRLTPQQTLATVHIIFNTTDDILTKYTDISFIFQTLHIDHVTIQPEFALPTDEIEKLGCHYQCVTSSNECDPLRCCEYSIINRP